MIKEEYYSRAKTEAGGEDYICTTDFSLGASCRQCNVNVSTLGVALASGRVPLQVDDSLPDSHTYKGDRASLRHSITVHTFQRVLEIQQRLIQGTMKTFVSIQ